jgi:hypothetical protein
VKLTTKTDNDHFPQKCDGLVRRSDATVMIL